ncbi:hypothetical protein NW762_007909 [Fusarium torreyae]|uniref:Carboxylic ester hydrolase n=1 Tax=Fusarium torreyae TaxID=1237075 RepID=A0A9W8VFS2_9HYPO|nr:hypothetical protein NW762_007909 [Fusarium torreyae]
MVSPLLWIFSIGISLVTSLPHQVDYHTLGPTVSLQQGLVVGKRIEVPSALSPTVDQYLGVPFAKSPPRRFEPPEDPIPHNASWDATYFRPSCIQYFESDDFRRLFNTPPLPESEDCLYLNVFTPSKIPRGGLPVLFWIHGGSFTLGSARIRDYDGSSFAANQGVIVVTINYRTNVFGFPAEPSIPLERRNVGLLDQRKALSWVNKNIRSFGGDPGKVTIFGESAGGWSVKELVINPPSPAQFRAAIIESQAFGPQTDNLASWNVLVRKLGCDKPDNTSSSLDCVVQVPTKSIRSVLEREKLGFTPTLDNSTNGPSFQADIMRNQTELLPMLIGTNANEGSVLTSALPPPEVLLDGIFGNDTDASRLARSAYPLNATTADLNALITTDYTYTCTTAAIARAAAKAGQSVWRYYFNATFSDNQPIPGAGAWHTSEIPIVFGTYSRDKTSDSVRAQLSRTMQQAWADFAKYPGKGPGWLPITPQTSNVRYFGTDEGAYERIRYAEGADDICTYYNASLSVNGF